MDKLLESYLSTFTPEERATIRETAENGLIIANGLSRYLVESETHTGGFKRISRWVKDQHFGVRLCRCPVTLIVGESEADKWDGEMPDPYQGFADLFDDEYDRQICRMNGYITEVDRFLVASDIIIQLEERLSQAA